MYILATVKITLDFYGNDYIEKKQSELKKLFKLIQRKFPVDLCEVDAFSDPEKCIFCYVLIGNDERKLKRRIESISAFIDKSSFARVVDDDKELIKVD